MPLVCALWSLRCAIARSSGRTSGVQRSGSQGAREPGLKVDDVRPLGRHSDARLRLPPQLIHPGLALLRPEVAFGRSGILGGDVVEHLNGRMASNVEDLVREDML